MTFYLSNFEFSIIFFQLPNQQITSCELKVSILPKCKTFMIYKIEKLKKIN